MMKNPNLERITLDELKSKLVKLPGLPAIILKIIEIIDEPDTDIQQLTALCSQDAAITSQILRIANSSFYGLNGQVASIREACMVLGIYTLRNTVLAAGFVNRFSQSNENALNHEQLWIHSLNVASIAGLLAKKLKLDENEIFTAGLIHDLGMFIMNETIPELYNTVIHAAEQKNISFQEVENEYLGFDHCDVGAIVVKEWKLPANIAHAIQFHHCEKKQTSATSVLVSVANIVEHELRNNSNQEDILALFSEDYLNNVQFEKQILANSLEECLQIVQHSSQYFV